MGTGTVSLNPERSEKLISNTSCIIFISAVITSIRSLLLHELNGAQPFSVTYSLIHPFVLCPGDLEAPDSRYQCGAQLLRNKSASKQFSVEDMMAVLRDEESGICRPGGAFPTAGSQVSVLGGGAESGLYPSCHWFTATPSPGCAVFKPFFFGSKNVQLTKATSCGGDAATGGQHQLWAAHAQQSSTMHSAQLALLESKYMELAFKKRDLSPSVDRDLFSEAVAEELTLYASQ